MPFPPKKGGSILAIDLEPPEPFEKKREVAKQGPPKPPQQQEQPREESGIQPNPAALGFRTEAETCGRCSYMQGDSCTHPLIAQAVGAGDSCAAFELKGMGQEEQTEEQPQESEEEMY